MNFTDENMTAIGDFTALTGIRMQTVAANKADEDTHPCRFCRSLQDAMPRPSGCCAKIHMAAHYTMRYGGGIFFCPTGLCHIVLPAPESSHTIRLSEPIVCGQPDSRAFESIVDRIAVKDTDRIHIINHASLLLFLRPEMLAKILRLLTALTGCRANPHAETIRRQLMQAAADNKPDMAKALLGHISRLIITDTGLEIELTRSLYADIIFTLYDMASACNDSALPEDTQHVLPTVLADADSIGKLESCLSGAAHQFMHAAFSMASLKHDSAIDKAVELIHLHYNKRLTEESVAGTVYMSPSYFSKIFKDSVGMGFTRYLNYIRIEKAKALLANPVVPLDSIHTMLGFEYRNYFGKIFKAATGTTPGAYRMLLSRQKKL